MLSGLVVVLVQNLPILVQLGDSSRGLKQFSEEKNLLNTRLSRVQGAGLYIVDETMRVGCTALQQCRGGAAAQSYTSQTRTMAPMAATRLQPAAGAAGG